MITYEEKILLLKQIIKNINNILKYSYTEDTIKKIEITIETSKEEKCLSCYQQKQNIKIDQAIKSCYE